jgi:chlorite dismutase
MMAQPPAMAAPARLFTFAGGQSGGWKVRSHCAFIGEQLPEVSCVDVINGWANSASAGWALHGITSNDRYVERNEKQELVSVQQGLGRPEAMYGALIPIRKSAQWWAMTQDERRAIFEEQSRHMRIGMKYLPPIARRLHHCRDLTEPEAFDFVTWFEYAPGYEAEFEQLLVELRSSEEWKYVEREVDIRLVRS